MNFANELYDCACENWVKYFLFRKQYKETEITLACSSLNICKPFVEQIVKLFLHFLQNTGNSKISKSENQRLISRYIISSIYNRPLPENALMIKTSQSTPWETVKISPNEWSHSRLLSARFQFMNVFITSADLSQQVYTPITSPASKSRSLRPSVYKTQSQPPWQTRQKCFSGCRKNWLLEDLSRGLDDLLGRNSIFPHKTLAVWRRCFVGGMPMTPGIGTRGMGKGKVFDGWREFSSQMPVNTCCLEVLLSRRKWFFY